MMRSVAVATLLALTGAAAAQTSELYLNDWSNTNTIVVQNGQIVRQFNRSGQFDGPASAIAGTIRNFGRAIGNAGREYDLNGNLIGGSYSNPQFTDCYDGATDGRNFNWSIAHNDFDNPEFTVVRAGRNWENPVSAWAPQRRSSGITYDVRNNSLWVTNTAGAADRVQQYSLNGQLISEFNVNIPGGYGIAYDPADDTLWIPESFGQPRLHQYAKNGTLLQIVTVQGMGTGRLGAEFNIPAPGAAVLIGLGGLAAARRRR